jgi:hypothetical protein
LLKKAIKYVDFNGETQVDVFYFNLTKAELVEMQLVEVTKDNEGGLKTMLEKIIADKSGAGIISTMKGIVLKAYGVRSEDGKRFMKSPALAAEFEATAAYSELFMELVTDAKGAAEFINGIVPAELTLSPEEVAAVESGKTASEIARERSEAQMQGFKPKEPTTVVAPQVDPTQRNLSEMSHEELVALAARAQNGPAL